MEEDIVKRLNANCTYKENRYKRQDQWKIADLEDRWSLDDASRCYRCCDGTGHFEFCKTCRDTISDYKDKKCNEMLLNANISICDSCSNKFRRSMFDIPMNVYGSGGYRIINDEFANEITGVNEFTTYDQEKKMKFIRKVTYVNDCPKCMHEIEFNIINLHYTNIEKQLNKIELILKNIENKK